MKNSKIEYSIYSPYSLKNGNAKNLHGDVIGGAPSSRHYMRTEDGAIISLGHVNWKWIHPYIQVDINGLEKPNTFGKDIFYFQLVNNKLSGMNYYGYDREGILENECSKSVSGQNRNMSCSALIMMDGWKIKDDYPW